MTYKDQVNTFAKLSETLYDFAARLEQKRSLLIEEQPPVEAIRQVAHLAADHSELARLWENNGFIKPQKDERPTKTGEFIRLDKAAAINDNYVQRFGDNADPSNPSTTSSGARLPLFPDVMWFVDARRLRDAASLKTNDGQEAHLIRVYPGINKPVGQPEYFTFIFTAEDIDQRLITFDIMDEASQVKMTDANQQSVAGASALEEIGTCNPCRRLSESLDNLKS